MSSADLSTGPAVPNTGPGVPNNCFAAALRKNIASDADSQYKLWSQMAGYIGLPLLISLLLTWLAAPRIDHSVVDVFFADLLKLTSLGSIAIHTIVALTDIQGRGIPTGIYKGITIYLIIVACVLVAHSLTIFLIAKQDLEGIASLPANQRPFHDMIYVYQDYTELGIAFLSSAYLFFFCYANYRVTEERADDFGITRFAQAFMYGANLPFIIGTIFVIVVFFIPSVLGEHRNSFLVGSITFLVFSSMAASICIDAYARPFLAVHNSSDNHAAHEPCYARKS